MSDGFKWLDPTRDTVDVDPRMLHPQEIYTLQQELKRYREFYAKSQNYGIRFTTGIHDAMYPHYEERLEYGKRQAAAELGVNIAKDRDWLHLPGDEPWEGGAYELTVVVWPQDFFHPKRPGE